MKKESSLKDCLEGSPITSFYSKACRLYRMEIGVDKKIGFEDCAYLFYSKLRVKGEKLRKCELIFNYKHDL